MPFCFGGIEEHEVDLRSSEGEYARDEWATGAGVRVRELDVDGVDKRERDSCGCR